MTQLAGGVGRLVDLRRAVLIEDVAGKVPPDVASLGVLRNAAAGSESDQVLARSVHVLEEERAVSAAGVPVGVEWIRAIADASDAGVLEAIHRVIVAVEDHAAALNGAGLIA